MRVKNDALLATASAQIAAETATAQASIGAEAEMLADQITNAVLKGRAN